MLGAGVAIDAAAGAVVVEVIAARIVHKIVVIALVVAVAFQVVGEFSSADETANLWCARRKKSVAVAAAVAAVVVVAHWSTFDVK